MADGIKRNKPAVRRYGLRHLAKAADAITRPAFGRRGFALGALLTHWPQIAGERLSDSCQPEKLHFAQGKGDNGTLWVRVDGAAALEFQHMQPVLIARINAQCGFRAVAALRIVQGPVAARPAPAAAPRPLRPTEKQAVLREVAQIANPELRAALERLGSGIQRRKKPC
ncbi:MAG: DciA family protein [Alphaproteobacteria bacterium]|nr:DciA family protein [Alphaproteobacteria bacterium]MDP1671474.1 DciA family protein [Alphaproteobacteria bacterium]